MAAVYIASQLGLPLHRAEPSTVITSLLGESARNLAAAFEAARREPSVFLLDEFDAFAKRRDDSYEVGELKRFVTTLLVELERGLPHGILIAATNHPALLDPAVHRRFDVAIDLDLPDAEARRRILLCALRNHPVDVRKSSVDLFAALTHGASGSDLRRLLDDALRAHLLAGEDLDYALIRGAIGREAGLPRDMRARLARLAKQQGLTTRDTAELLGCSHTTVRRLLATAA
jgi:SpoVK/Ycf46/Vps4 family AAA+-type ATPase